MSAERTRTISAQGEAKSEGAAAPAAERELRGTAIDHFTILGQVGQGGMGVVLSAYDSTLDRKVAIKLIRSGQGARASALRERLLREARAMAKLNHPNVVAVHEVGVFRDDVYVAMEYAEGGTLRDWLQKRRPTWEQVLNVFVQAGKGLAAAHAAGIVHRDFKPENVLLGKDGRVVVADFGLASLSDAGSGADSVSTAVSPGHEKHPPEPLKATETGRILGTPAYMAPEQLSLGAVDARADQFAFCVALYEALYGRRPFSGDSIETLRSAIVAGVPQPPASDSNVPRWLWATIERGLRPGPAERYTQLGDILDQLEREPRRRQRRRTRWIAGGAGAALLGVAGAAIAIVGVPGAAPRVACDRGAATIADAWNPASKANVLGSLRGSGTESADLLVASLDRYADDWATARNNACKATHHFGEQSEELLDRRIACLDQKQSALDGLIEAIAAGPMDALGATRANTAASSLPAIADCARVETLLAGPDAAPSSPAENRLRARLERGFAEDALARHEAAEAIAAEVLQEAEAASLRGVAGRARLLKARTQQGMGQHGAASDTLRAALSAVLGPDSAALEVELLAELVFSLGEAAHYSEANLAAVLAEQSIARSPDPDWSRARLQNSHGNSLRAAGELERARALLEPAAAFFERRLGADAPRAMSVKNNLGIVYEDLGELERAVAVFDSVADAASKVLGSNHPRVAEARLNAGVALRQLGRPGEAKERYLQAIAIWQSVYPSDHPDLAQAWNNLGNIEFKAGRLDEAAEAFGKSLAALRSSLGEDSGRLAQPLMNLGLVFLQRGDIDDALQLFAESAAIAEARLGENHPELGLALINLGEGYRAARTPAKALAPLRRALGILESTHGPTHFYVGYTLLTLGAAQLDVGAKTEAAKNVRRARSLLSSVPDAALQAELETQSKRAGLSL